MNCKPLKALLEMELVCFVTFVLKDAGLHRHCIEVMFLLCFSFPCTMDKPAFASPSNSNVKSNNSLNRYAFTPPPPSPNNENMVRMQYCLIGKHEPNYFFLFTSNSNLPPVGQGITGNAFYHYTEDKYWRQRFQGILYLTFKLCFCVLYIL